eukprot:1217358-Rhodomonas_salina.1
MVFPVVISERKRPLSYWKDQALKSNIPDECGAQCGSDGREVKCALTSGVRKLTCRLRRWATTSGSTLCARCCPDPSAAHAMPSSWPAALASAGFCPPANN